MEGEDVIPLPDESGIDRDGGEELSHEIGEDGDGVGVPAGESLGRSVDDADVEEGQYVSSTDVVEEADFVKAENIPVSGDVTALLENGCLNDTDLEEGQLSDMDTEDETLSILPKNIETATKVDEKETHVKADNLPSGNGCMMEPPRTNVASTSGVKRTRATFDEQQASVQVKYFGLSRGSKQKLEELLREWSEWHAQNSSERQDEYGVSETGEETYFPALDIGTGKNSAVSFWLENEIRKPGDKDIIPVEDASVPLYDRGFALGSISADGSSNLEGGSEFLDAPRCFNCSSYSHSLRECPKPRNNDAVNNSRKQLKSKRNQTAGMRNPVRYYEDTPSGKYEGLKPGSLDAETRRLLGLGESDPPPWLNRMREIGYPPGYLEPDDENLPSGITIFSSEEVKDDKEDGEIEAELDDTPKKMSVNYPGVNAPIPKNADEKDWAARPSIPDRNRNGDSGRFTHSSMEPNRRFREKNNQDFKEDALGFDRSSRYASRYGDQDFNSSSRNRREDDSRPRSPTYGRSTGERGRNDPLESEDSLAYSLYSSFSYGSDVSKADYTPRSRDREDRHRSRRER
ncbi:uncharacterized protein LOC141595676 isoform X2 [Silene latifolia]|uniref:uncharacterized protein LOC141595676 isoform X2 n=1 Tax=Silene latifolia TaxID=37657 RepID=UPI003D76FCEE